MAFGKRQGGGRRASPRLPIGLTAAINSLEFTGRAVMVDVSGTGAKLKGSNLPHRGHDVWIRVGVVDVLATVVWTGDGECGVTFDVPLTSPQLHQLRTAGNHARFARLTPDQVLAVEDWTSGLAR